MDSGQREGDKAPCKANGGLDSLVAAASRGTEDDKPEEEVNRKEDNSEKREEPSKGQKGKVCGRRKCLARFNTRNYGCSSHDAMPLAAL